MDGKTKGVPLYYYTTTQTMQSILTNGTFWATNILYMNDSEEYVNGLREIRGIFTRRKNLSYRDINLVDQLIRIPDPHIFTISFCTSEDLLSQWCVYARESGVNLELDFDLLEGDGSYTFYCMRNSTQQEEEIEVSAPLKPVIYFTRNAMPDGKEVNDREAEIIKRMDLLEIRNGADGTAEKISELAAQIKRYEFSGEREWRLFFNMTAYAEDYKKTPFFYRVQDNILKPFIKVSAFGRDPAEKTRKGPWPVTAIMVGPGYNQDQVFKSLRYFLNFGNYVRRDETAFWERSLDRFMEKTQARCSPAAKDSMALQEEIERYRKKSRPPLSMANLMCELAASFKKDLAIKFPECTEALDAIELTNSGIILQKSNIPYIY